MNKIQQKKKLQTFERSLEELHSKVIEWNSEIEYIHDEQFFMRELLLEHFIDLCTPTLYSQSQLFIVGISHEKELGFSLKASVWEHEKNLSMLMKNMHAENEDKLREEHDMLKTEIKNYIDNFKFIKQEVFAIILKIMKKNK